MTAKEYLGRALSLERQIDAKLEQRARLRATLTRCASQITGMPRGSGADGTNVADKVMQMDTEIEGQMQNLFVTKQSIVQVIAAIPQAEHRELLEYRYLCGWSWNRIANAMHYDRKTIWRMHGRALRQIATFNAI